METDFPMFEFESYSDLEKWFEENAERADGFWLRFYKKNSGKKTVTYDEAIELSLCFGWIDSQVKKCDEISYLQKFTPRRKKSIWSKVNTEKVERFVKEGKMRPSGLKAVDEAKADGRWEKAYHSPSTMETPEDFLKDLAKDRKAEEFFNTLNKANVYAIAWRLQTAKTPETREKRKKIILEMLSKGKKFH